MNEYTSYTYTTVSQSSDTNLAASLLMIFLVALFVSILYAIKAILLGRIFKKAGVPQWAAWVPFYGPWKLLEIGGQQGFWAVLEIVPIVNIVSAIFMYIAMYHVGKKLGKSGYFFLWAIIVPIVWLVWLALDNSKWGDTHKTTAPASPAAQK